MRGGSHRRGALGLLIAALFTMSTAGCGGSAAPTASAPPPTLPMMTEITPTAPLVPLPTVGEPVIWLEQPFGKSDTLAVLFYEDETSRAACVRLMIRVPISRCASGGNTSLIAVQGIETDDSGETFTIIAGRVLRPEVVVISVVFADGESFPLTVDESGIILLAPGRRDPREAVPIDQFGNIVGEIFRF